MRSVRRLLKLARAALLTGVTGCASLAHGTKQTVPITSSPPGAPVTIDGVRVGVTPYRARLARGHRHHVLIGADSATQVQYTLTRRLSVWLLADLVFYPAILVDLITGAGLAFTSGSLHATLPATAAIASSTTEPVVSHYYGLWPGHALRLTTPESRGKLVDATLDSVVAERLYWRPRFGATDGSAPPSVALADARRLQVRRAPAYSVSGNSLVHYATQLAWAVPLVLFSEVGSQDRGFKTGARMSAIAIPVAFVLGAAGAPVRWAPFEAQRSGSPLLVNDQVRVRPLQSGEVVSGRLVDMTPRHFLIKSGRDTVHVLRTNVRSVERAEGFDFRHRAFHAAAVGAMFGFYHLSTCACSKNNQADMYTFPIGGALLGLLAAPALAPRRWHNVSAW